MSKIVLAASVLALLAFEGRAPACYIICCARYQIDPQEQAVDVTPPGAVSVAELVITRGEMGGCELNSCDGIGLIDLTLTASDDRTPAEDLGYKLRFASGERPDGNLSIPEEPVHGTMTLPWDDGASEFQESFDFFLEIAAVDRAGNTGPWTLIEIADGGSGCGCRVRGGGTASLGVFVLGLGLLGLLRRRWRRR